MSLLQEIFAWSKGLPPWQSDAIARLLAKQALSQTDYEDLLALLKGAHGIPDPEGREPNPLAAEQIPESNKQSPHVELLAIKSLRHVNAIAPNQVLPISAIGMTVIYGDNGSGKSGYSRVLKRACRARDQSEDILPNANLKADASSIPEATFEIAVGGGAAQDVLWKQGALPPAELSTLSIFDARCARAYLDSEDDFSYVPYGLDVFEGLAKVCNELRASIALELAHSAPDLEAFKLLQGKTAVGKMISTLSATTLPDQVETLATLSSEETQQHATLTASLKEANPTEKANQLRMREQRIRTIATNAVSMWAGVDDAAITNLQTLSDALRVAKEAAALASAQFNEKESLLSGTGGEAWRELFEATRKFALESHPGNAFPDLDPESPCPLCQQPLKDGASRLLRFEAFIEQEAEKTSQERRAALLSEYQKFMANIPLGLDDVTFAEIQALDAQLAIDTKAFEAGVTIRQAAAKSALSSNDWSQAKAELANPSVRLSALADTLKGEAEALDKVSDEKARAALQAQLDELNARIQLGLVKEAVTTAVEKLAHQACLSKCLSALKTNAISIKAAELAEKVVSQELATALNNEFKALGVGHLSVSLQSRADKGKALHKLKLALPQSRSPSDILSEGEQRAIAIGSFLAEIGLSGGTGGIVFDDPVSSLDHRRRERVAERLAGEAAKRQVIVFTHDIYFLCVLVEEAGRMGVPISTQSILRRPIGFGVAEPELPFEGKNTGKRIGVLKEHQVSINKLFKNGDEQAHRNQTVAAYFHLRMAWERAVEEVLLNGTIVRFRKGIETQKLARVVVDDDDFYAVHAGMTRCSNYAHDKAMQGGVAVPDPDELLEDILALEAWRAKVNKRSEETAKARKAKTSAA